MPRQTLEMRDRTMMRCKWISLRTAASGGKATFTGPLFRGREDRRARRECQDSCSYIGCPPRRMPFDCARRGDARQVPTEGRESFSGGTFRRFLRLTFVTFISYFVSDGTGEE